MVRKRVSVLIPTFRRPEFVSLAIQSCQVQTYADLEILVGDDASGDETESVVRRLMAIDGRIQFFPHSQNVGQARIRNELLERAEGEYIQFLDDDDLIHAEKFKLSVEALEADPEAGLAASQTGFFLHLPGDSTFIWNRLLGGDLLMRFLRHDMPWVTIGPLWRAEALRQMDLTFDTRISHSDDFLHSTRALIRGARAICLPYLLNYYRRQEGYKVSQIGRTTRPLMHQRCFGFFVEELKEHGLWNEDTQREMARNFRWNVSRALARGDLALACEAAQRAAELEVSPAVVELMKWVASAATKPGFDPEAALERNETFPYDREVRESWWGRYHQEDEALLPVPRSRRFSRSRSPS